METRLEKLEVKERPKDEAEIKMELGQVENPVSKVIASGKGIHIRFGKRVLLEDGSFEVKTRSKTALIGSNGTGKTTLIKRLLEGAEGFNLARSVKIGYFSQGLDLLDDDKTIFENVMAGNVQKEAVVRTILARLLFKREEVFKKASVLSGGERVKVIFAKLMTMDANFLILDEPTNYLDILSVEALQNLLLEYGGTVLLVSHDRRFIDRVADHLLVLEERKLTAFQGNYTQYSEWAANKNRRENGSAVEELMLRMRLAELNSRISFPSKDDNLEELDREFKEIARKLRALTN
ncbi:MAG: ATP-binding cassette domain-containing protein [Clostridiales bacterium]|jgi:macrolide transport system ATP-binding/permease protein|nr:ATP-binding cassette domain-containing protein [Eubacteriales bacterium]MDH7567525.1 ATP-binding cassette domain-containing protein [Clostridiales bacterium]